MVTLLKFDNQNVTNREGRQDVKDQETRKARSRLAIGPSFSTRYCVLKSVWPLKDK
jgi:hypothetical protein